MVSAKRYNNAINTPRTPPKNTINFLLGANLLFVGIASWSICAAFTELYLTLISLTAAARLCNCRNPGTKDSSDFL